MPGRLTLKRGKLLRRFGENLYPRTWFARTLERMGKSPMELKKAKRRSATIKNLEIRERLSFRKKMQTWYGRKYHGWAPWLEQRADQVMVRSGLAATLPAARQRINHRTVYVNEEPITSPGVILKPGDILTVAPLRSVERTLPEALRGAAEQHQWLKLMWTSLMDPLAIRTHSVLRTIFPGIHEQLQPDASTWSGNAAAAERRPEGRRGGAGKRRG
ncbi:unnamed protein product [Pedinophyceae sp. YPF-701]|nr:unnamed protein product [Pedinophyceae sp. YPF-701]